ncbi:VWA domain-containing protein [Deinococcus altitudinis]|uniref:VWA domain-containing protein n=1 Tax=Deinococcus altitudinis TaxID=468914 RepID=UPI00389239FF
MQILITGQKVKLSALTPRTQLQVQVHLQHPDIDLALFGLSADSQLVDDRYFVFFNQPASPEGAITLSGNPQQRTFSIDLHRLPGTVERLMFTATSDSQPVGAMSSGTVRLSDTSGPLAEYTLARAGSEKALMLLELYRHSGEWRVAAVGQGFSGGLKALIEHFGGEVTEPPASVEPPPPSPPVRPPPPSPVLSKLDLRKKSVSVVLTKAGIQGVQARVMVVMDASGSMDELYRSGTVQDTLERLIPVAMKLDDNEAMEFWYYASHFAQMGDLDEHSVIGLVGESRPQNQSGQSAAVKALGFGNNEPPVMRDVLDTHRTYHQQDRTVGAATMPTLVLFLTDGGIDAATSRQIEQLIKSSTGEPLFWQFVGLGRSGFGVLEKLDTLKGREIDNSGFFAVNDITKLSDDELYQRLLSQFAVWWQAWQRRKPSGTGTPTPSVSTPTARGSKVSAGRPVTLTKSASVSLQKAGTITTALEWKGNGDLDLYAFYVLKDGTVGKVYYKDKGRKSKPPYITLSGDSRTAGREEIILHRPELLAHVLIAAYSAVKNGLGSFASYKPQAVVTDNLGQQVIVPLLNRNHFSFWVAITKLDFTDSSQNAVSHVERYSGFMIENSPKLHANGTFEMNKGPVEFKK